MVIIRFGDARSVRWRTDEVTPSSGRGVAPWPGEKFPDDVKLDEALGLNCAWYADILLTLTAP